MAKSKKAKKKTASRSSGARKNTRSSRPKAKAKPSSQKKAKPKTKAKAKPKPKAAKKKSVTKKPAPSSKKSPASGAGAKKKSSPTAPPRSQKLMTKPVLSRPVAVDEPPKLIPVPLPEGVRPQRLGEPNERSAHLDKLKQLFEAAPISRYLGMTLGYCENGVARVRLPFRKDFEEGHGVIHGGLIGLLGDTAGNFAVGSVSPGSTVKTVEFKLSLLAGVQGDLLAIGEVVRKGRTLATCRLEVVEGNDRVIAIGLATYALQAV
jgi:uncharacterized protein (TIGR00369 family)